MSHQKSRTEEMSFLGNNNKASRKRKLWESYPFFDRKHLNKQIDDKLLVHKLNVCSLWPLPRANI